ncbi:hypothetical protein [Massilia pseudoviolaceinigra]|nr:hypothetical protein [Massilia sp. CCM 9206]MDQ1923231.1 hypothetical protein [Massilia sp. CCM 9206]
MSKRTLRQRPCQEEHSAAARIQKGRMTMAAEVDFREMLVILATTRN